MAPGVACSWVKPCMAPPYMMSCQSARGAEFLTEPKDHAREIRAYIRDPDGHLIEVGQTTARPGPA